MPAFLLPLLNIGGSAVEWLFGTKTGRIVLLALIASLAFLAWTLHVKHEQAAADAAKAAAAAAAEHQRREADNAFMQQWAIGANQHVDQLNATIAQLQGRSTAASHANDAKPAFDADAVARLNGVLPGAGHPAGH